MTVLFRTGMRIKINTDAYSPHLLKGQVYPIIKRVGSSRFRVNPCSAGGACDRCGREGWHWDEQHFSVVRPDLKSGDKITFHAGNSSHLKAEEVYTVKGVLSKRDASGHQVFTIEECQLDRNAGHHVCSCRDGREWIFDIGFDFADVNMMPVTLEESRNAKTLPTIEDVADFFKIKRVE